MTRTPLAVVLAAAALAAGPGCCHHAHRPPAAGVPVPAAPPPVIVSRVDGLPVPVPVPPAGLTLRDALAASRGVAAAADATDPAYLFAAIDRAEGRHVFALPVVTDTPAGLVRLVPGETVSLLRWRDTDLARGLGRASIDRVVSGAVPPPPPPPPGLRPEELIRWADAAINDPPILDQEALGPIDAALDQAKADPAAQAVVLAEAMRTQLAVSFPTADLPAAGGGKAAADRFYQDKVVPAVTRVAAKFYADRLRPELDWPALAGIYGGRLAGDSTTVAIGLTLDGQEVPLPAAQRRVRLPAVPAAPVHPMVGTTVAGHLAVRAADAVVVVRREVGGRPTEFVLPLPPDDGTPASADVHPVVSAKQQVLLSTLLFDGDQVDVTSPMRLPVVLTSALAPLVRQTLTPAAPPARPHRLFHHKDACPPPAAPVPVVPAPVPVPVLP